MKPISTEAKIEELLKIPLLGGDIQELHDGISALLLEAKVEELERLAADFRIATWTHHDKSYEKGLNDRLQWNLTTVLNRVKAFKSTSGAKGDK